MISLRKQSAHKKVALSPKLWAPLLLLAIGNLNHRSEARENGHLNGNFLKVGHSFHVFTPEDDLRLTMRYAPEEEYIPSVNYKTVDVFKNLESLTKHSVDSEHETGFLVDFRMDLCDNVQQLLQAFFRDFTFEKVQHPWKAFTGKWNVKTLAKQLGINVAFVMGDYYYIIVRFSRFRQVAWLTDPTTNTGYTDSLSKAIDKVKVGDYDSVVDFIRNHGSHYISSFITGNSLYQVFVYDKITYSNFKNRLSTGGISDISNAELAFFFSPWKAKHIGQIKVASGNQTVASWVASELTIRQYMFNFQTLFKIQSNPYVLQKLGELLQNEALLNVNMKTLSPVFKNPAKLKWFDDVLTNYLNLWEVNL